MPVDFGCELFPENVSFCQKIAEHQCDLQRVGGNVCSLAFLTHQKRCPASSRIVEMTGFFRDKLPFLADSTPFESFEAEWDESSNIGGLKFSCFFIIHNVYN